MRHVNSRNAPERRTDFQSVFTKDIGVPPHRINEIVHAKRAITTDTAFRLSQYFGNSAQFWLCLQADYDLRRMERAGGLPKIARCTLLAAA